MAICVRFPASMQPKRAALGLSMKELNVPIARRGIQAEKLPRCLTAKLQGVASCGFAIAHKPPQQQLSGGVETGADINIFVSTVFVTALSSLLREYDALYDSHRNEK